MKIRGINWVGAVMILLMIGVVACVDKNLGPTFKTDWATTTDFKFTSPATAPAVVVTPANVNELFDSLTWTAPDYGGVDLSTTYTLQASLEKFTEGAKVVKVMDTYTNYALPTMAVVNTAALSLGITQGTADTIWFRVQVMLTSVASDTAHTDLISRIITPFKLSSCGTYCSMGIIGSATPGSWDLDTDMNLADPADLHTWTVTLFLKGGQEAKFRTGHDWGTNWGGTSAGSGTATSNITNPNIGNIPVSNDGFYKVTFNDETLAYTFDAVTAATYDVIGLVGDATPGGWPDPAPAAQSDTDLAKLSQNNHMWGVTLDLTVANAKFRANHAWDVNWGIPASGSSFPSAIGKLGGDNIPIPTAGTYHAVINDVTGEYAFGGVVGAFAPLDTVGIVGDATPQGWDIDTKLQRNPNNPYLFSGVVTLIDGSVKFRANKAWDVNWGGVWSSAIGAFNGPNIPAKAGKYFVTINTLTGEYSFIN